MSYLNKSERKKLIIEAAKSIALEDGLSTLTVRKIAQKASLSVGLIHHHFSSVHELKSNVFIELAYHNLDSYCLIESLNWKNQLLNILGFIEQENELAYIRLWNEAEQISQSNAEFAKVYWLAIEAWKAKIVHILQSIRFKNSQENLDDLAWQLIGITLGFERLAKFNKDVFYHDYMSYLILQSVERKTLNEC